MLFIQFLYAQFFTTPPIPTTSLRGQTIIITGANRGLGYEVAKHVARLGASKIIFAVRSTSAGEEARLRILEANPFKTLEIEVWPLDMTDYSSVKMFAQRAGSLPRIDALINNAGIFTENYKTAEDNESTLTVNVVSTFLLTLMMLPKLRESANTFNTTPRISVVGSEGMNWVNFKERKAKEGAIFETLNNKTTANMQERYFLTKLFVMFCIQELATQMDQSTNNNSKRSRVILNCPAPGYVATGFSNERGSTAIKIAEGILGRKPEVGSRCIVDGAVRGPESHGQYLSECKVKP